MIQVRVIEQNDNEGETFSYVLNVTQERAEQLRVVFEDLQDDGWEIEINTSYTPELIETLNKHVDNNYMDYIGFYKIPDDQVFISEDTFYKGSGLEKID